MNLDDRWFAVTTAFHLHVEPCYSVVMRGTKNPTYAQGPRAPLNMRSDLSEVAFVPVEPVLKLD